MSPNPAQMLGASFDFYTGEVANMDAIGPELNADHLGNLELTRCLIISSQCYRVLEQARLWLSGVVHRQCLHAALRYHCETLVSLLICGAQGMQSCMNNCLPLII